MVIMMMEGMKGGGGRVNNVVVGQHDQDQDMGDGMQCSDHPYRSNPGGICAFCLQEKLGKLVSSSFPLPPNHPSAASSSSSPSFRSDNINAAVAHKNANVAAAAPSSASASSLSLSLSLHPTSSAKSTTHIANNYHHDDDFYKTRRARISFLLAKKKKKVGTTVASSDRAPPDMVFKRSKSTTTPRRGHQFLDGSEDFSPRKRGGFWSFLYHSSAKSSSSSNSLNKKAVDKSSFRDNSKISSSSSFTSSVQKDTKCPGSSSLRNKSEHMGVEVDEDSVSPNSSQATVASFERKVSRSRSVGCGSRSFSGDFFERISTGFGDCTLRRVESQREGKPKASTVHRAHGEHNSSSNHCMKERVKCGGIFSGFMMTSSSSSSSSSSYWVPSSAEGPLVHGRSRSWGWAFASPMRAFTTKPSSSSSSSGKDGKRDIVRQASDKNTTPNLNAIPSLLSVRT